MITFNCACGQAIKVSDDKAGKAGRCPKCHKVVQIPSAPDAPAEQDPLAALAGKSPEAPVADDPLSALAALAAAAKGQAPPKPAPKPPARPSAKPAAKPADEAADKPAPKPQAETPKPPAPAPEPQPEAPKPQAEAPKPPPAPKPKGEVIEIILPTEEEHIPEPIFDDEQTKPPLPILEPTSSAPVEIPKPSVPTPPPQAAATPPPPPPPPVQDQAARPPAQPPVPASNGPKPAPAPRPAPRPEPSAARPAAPAAKPDRPTAPAARPHGPSATHTHVPPPHVPTPAELPGISSDIVPAPQANYAHPIVPKKRKTPLIIAAAVVLVAACVAGYFVFLAPSWEQRNAKALQDLATEARRLDDIDAEAALKKYEEFFVLLDGRTPEDAELQRLVDGARIGRDHVQAYLRQPLINRAYPASPFIRTATRSGWGFLVRDNGNLYLATNRRLIENPNLIDVFVTFGENLSGNRILSISPNQVRYVHRTADLALIDLRDEGASFKARGIRPLKLGEAGSGQKVQIPAQQDQAPGITEADCQAIVTLAGQGPGLKLSFVCPPGLSGGPVLDPMGKVVGILTNAAAEGPVAGAAPAGPAPAGVGYAISSAVLRDLLQQPAQHSLTADQIRQLLNPPPAPPAPAPAAPPAPRPPAAKK